MSLALGKDPVFEKFRGALQEALEGIEKVLVITPSVAYLEAVETIHTNL